MDQSLEVKRGARLGAGASKCALGRRAEAPYIGMNFARHRTPRDRTHHAERHLQSADPRTRGEHPRLGRLPAPQATSRQHSKLCGSTVTVDLTLEDGRVADYAQDVKACALGQAAASIVGRHVLGATPSELREVRDRVRGHAQGARSGPRWGMGRRGGAGAGTRLSASSRLDVACLRGGRRSRYRDRKLRTDALLARPSGGRLSGTVAGR